MLIIQRYDIRMFINSRYSNIVVYCFIGRPTTSASSSLRRTQNMQLRPNTQSKTSPYSGSFNNDENSHKRAFSNSFNMIDQRQVSRQSKKSEASSSESKTILEVDEYMAKNYPSPSLATSNSFSSGKAIKIKICSRKFHIK